MRHPQPSDLRAWVSGERDDLARHIERCSRCQAALESMTDLGPALRRELSRVTSPGTGFLGRMNDQLGRRKGEIEAWGTLVDLFSLPWQVFGAVVRDDGD